MPKKRLDVLLVERGLAETRAQAQALVLAGRVRGHEKAGEQVDEAAELDADWMIDHMGIEISATRRKCALLNLKVLRGAVTGDPSWPESS